MLYTYASEQFAARLETTETCALATTQGTGQGILPAADGELTTSIVQRLSGPAGHTLDRSATALGDPPIRPWSRRPMPLR